MLTDAKVAKVKPGKARQLIADGQVPGLFLRVHPSGAKTFTLVTRDPYGRQKWREVEGVAVGVDTLDSVRDKARAAIREIKAGRDPFPKAVAPESFKAVAENWYKLHVEKKGLRSAGEIKRVLTKHVYPALTRDFTAIRRSDVTAMLDTIEANSGPRQADVALAIVRKIMNWSAARLDDYAPPLAGGMARTNPKERARARILSDDELRVIWPHLDGTFGAFAKVLLLTGQRREKVAAMKWDDVASDGTWTIPTEAREKGNAGKLVLPQMARKIIAEQKRIEGNPYVFPGRGESHISGFTQRKCALDAKVTKALRKPLQDWTLHDLRRTARSLLSRAGVDSDTAERVLGHKLQGVRGVYDRHDYAPEIAGAVEKLAAQVGLILNPPADNVIALSEKRA